MSKNMPLVSVIMPNFNYEKYVGAAIDSALNLDWPNIEVIVIDDGSTDGSRAVIQGYGDRIKFIFQENAGQVVACNAGFAMSRGEIIIFLDSDDCLHPSLMREVYAVWRPGISKVQTQMMIIDGEGNSSGNIFPQYSVTPTPERVREWHRVTATYPTPPGSGNIYSRAFLNKIFPLDNSCGTASDTMCIMAAPFLGDVMTLVKPLVSYRVHGRNQGAMLSLNVDRFSREVTRALQRFGYGQRIAKSAGIDMPDNALNRGLSYLQYRLASYKLVPRKHPIHGDSLMRILSDILVGAMCSQGFGYDAKIVMLVWLCGIAIVPNAMARHLIEWRFSPGTRPEILRSFLRLMKITR